MKITVIDYGIGNILSVIRAFEYCGSQVFLSDSPEEILNAEALVLPGVGAFADGMQGLRDRNLIEPIREFSKKGKPFLGICLGMQMMLEQGEEFGIHEGLGLIPGKVVEIEHTEVDGTPQKIPHVGWNELKLPIGKSSEWWRNTILSGIKEGESTYFVHSFTAMPADEKYRLADTYYGGRCISAMLKNGNLYGSQFHPEKSGKVGLNIIRNFLNICNINMV